MYGTLIWLYFIDVYESNIGNWQPLVGIRDLWKDSWSKIGVLKAKWNQIKNDRDIEDYRSVVIFPQWKGLFLLLIHCRKQHWKGEHRCQFKEKNVCFNEQKCIFDHCS